MTLENILNLAILSLITIGENRHVHTLVGVFIDSTALESNLAISNKTDNMHIS